MRSFVLPCLLFLAVSMQAEDRFGRPVVKVSDPSVYQFVKLDDVNYPLLTNADYDVTCLVSRGTHHYYVEIGVKNKTSETVVVTPDSISFEKPGYSTFETDPLIAAREAASAASLPFVPTPPSYVPPTTNTTINATATTYGNQTNINGTATTTTDSSGQAGANLGNAIGNAFAARSFHKHQREEAMLVSFITSHLPMTDGIAPGQSRVSIFTFDQSKPKKAPFTVSIRVGSQTLKFAYKE